MSSRQSRGHIEFDALTDESFETLVAETLETSNFIEVEDGVIYEVNA